MAMTTATKITVFRMFLIPVFVVLAILYGNSVRDGQPLAYLRWAAVASYLVAAISDAVDGYLARHYNQATRLGAILDPLADKLFMLAAVVTLSYTDWGTSFPVWYVGVVLIRDFILVVGAFMMDKVMEQVKVEAVWSGKVATTLQLVAVGWLMFQFHPIGLTVLIIASSIFTIFSALLYIQEGLRQVHKAAANV